MTENAPERFTTYKRDVVKGVATLCALIGFGLGCIIVAALLVFGATVPALAALISISVLTVMGGVLGALIGVAMGGPKK